MEEVKKVMNEIFEKAKKLEVLKFYIKYLEAIKKNKYCNNMKKKMEKYLSDKDVNPKLRFKEFFSELYFYDILKKLRYVFTLDYKNTQNNKDVDFLINIGNNKHVLLEVCTPWNNNWYEFGILESKKVDRNVVMSKWANNQSVIIDTGGKWRAEVGWKILNEAYDRRGKFDVNIDYKFILFSLSDFHIFKFKEFYERYIESKHLKFLEKHRIDPVIHFQQRNKLKEYNYILQNQGKLKCLKTFYTGFIFFEIYEANEYEVGNLWVRNFQKNLDQNVKRFIENIKKEAAFKISKNRNGSN